MRKRCVRVLERRPKRDYALNYIIACHHQRVCALFAAIIIFKCVCGCAMYSAKCQNQSVCMHASIESGSGTYIECSSSIRCSSIGSWGGAKCIYTIRSARAGWLWNSGNRRPFVAPVWKEIKHTREKNKRTRKVHQYKYNIDICYSIHMT